MDEVLLDVKRKLAQRRVVFELSRFQLEPIVLIVTANPRADALRDEKQIIAMNYYFYQ